MTLRILVGNIGPTHVQAILRRPDGAPSAAVELLKHNGLSEDLLSFCARLRSVLLAAGLDPWKAARR